MTEFVTSIYKVYSKAQTKLLSVKLFCTIICVFATMIEYTRPSQAQTNPVATISALHQTREEGNPLVFVVRLATTTTNSVTIDLDYKVEGEFLHQDMSELPTSLVIPANNDSIDLRIPTVNDNVYEANGSLEVTISGVPISPAGTNTVKVIINDNDMPSGISITSVRSTVIEGEDVKFQITTSPISTEDQEIDITISETGDFVDGAFPESIQIDALNKFAILTIPTDDDQTDEANAIVTASIDPNSNYVVAPSPNNSATVNVSDNDGDLPVISLTKVSLGAIVEGSPAVFRISSSEIVSSNTTINYEITEVGDFLLPNQVAPLTLNTGNYSTTKEFATTPDDIFEAHGEIQMKILSGDDYQVSKTNFVASIPLLDNDTPTGLSVAPVENNINEGEQAKFEIRTLLPVLGDLDVNYTLSKFNGFITTTVSATAVISRQNSSTIVEIETQNQIYNPNYTMTLTLNTSNDYTLTPLVANRSAEITIQDDEQIPEVTVSPIVAEITEGGLAGFLISGPGVVPIHQQINYAISQTGDFLESTANGTTHFEAGQSSSIIYIATIDDEIYETNGQVTLTIQSGTGYNINSSEQSATINVTSDDLEPVLTLRTQNDTIIEGESADFIIDSTTAPSSDLQVNVSVTQGLSDFILGPSPTQKTMLAGKKSAILAIPTNDDTYPEADGEITVSITEGSNYSFNVLTSQASIIVRNNDNARRVSILANSEFVTEGTAAEFTLTASSAVNTATTVLLDVETSGDFIMGSIPTSHQIPTNDSTSTLSFTTENDSDFESDGHVKVTIKDGTDYLKGDTNHTAEIQIRDDDNTAGISIVATTTSVIEGGVAKFQLKTSPVPTEEIVVRLAAQFTGTGYPSQSIQYTQIRIGANKTMEQFEISIPDNSEIDTNSYIIVNIVNQPSYTTSTKNNADSIRIIDNEPELAIATNNKSLPNVTEGEPVYFDLSFSEASHLDRTVSINLSQGNHNFIFGTLTRTVEFTAGETEKILKIYTLDNNIAEPNGEISASITSGTGYILHPLSQHRSASITILDNEDEPVLSISAKQTAVVEGVSAIFTINSSILSRNAIDIGIIVSENATDFIRGTPPNTIELPAMKKSVNLEIKTFNDYTTEPDGTITVELQSGSNYVLHNYVYQANVRVESDDNTTTISVSANTIQVIEGQDLNFTISASPAMNTSRNINYVVSQHGNFIAETGIESVRLPANQREITITLNTVNDSGFEPHGFVTVSIRNGFGYNVAPSPQNSAKIKVLDNDHNASGMAIVAVTHFLAEGETPQFQLIAPATSTSDREINVFVTLNTRFRVVQHPTQSVTLPANELRTLLEIDTVDDTTDEEYYSIIATILPGTGYTVAGFPYNSAVVTVSDNDSTPVISIAAINEEVTEGTPAQFRLTTPIASGNELAINVETSSTGDFLLGTPLTQVGMVIDTTEQIFEIETVADYVYEVDGKITVRVGSGDGYLPASSPDNTATVKVNNNDFPNGVSVLNINDNVVEGNPAKFQIATPTPSNQDRTIKMGITQVGTYYSGQANRQITLGAGKLTVAFEVTTDADLIDEDYGAIIATVLPGSNYTLASFQHRKAQVNMVDDDTGLPVASISNGANVVEGSNATFQITLAPAPSQRISVNIDANDGVSNFINPTQQSSVVFEAGDSSETISISTIDDETIEAQGYIYVTLENGTGYTRDPTNYKTKVRVLDDDLRTSHLPTPQLRVLVESHSINEGGIARWELRLDRPSTTTLALTFNIRSIKGVTPNEVITNESLNIEIPPGTTSYTIDHHTEDDVYSSRYYLLGQVTSQPSSHTIMQNNTNISVVNNDSVPTMTITPISSSITEGEFARYIITRDGATIELENVMINLTATGDFVPKTSPKFVQFGEHDFKYLIISTQDDIVDEAHGSLTATIGLGLHYTANSAASSATITIMDDDATPEISVDGVTSFIYEGEMAKFLFTTPTAPGADLTINFTLTQGTGNYISGALPTSKVLPAFAFEVIIAIPTINDMTLESEADIILTLTSSSTYNINSEKSSATIEAWSEEGLTYVGIMQIPFTVTEGRNVSFILQSSARLAANISVNIKLQEIGNYISGPLIRPGDSENVAIMSAGNLSRTYAFATEDDNVSEADGLITLEILPGPGYLVDRTKSRLTQTIKDNDILNGISITAREPVISEGEFATFQFFSSTIPNPRIKVHFHIAFDSLFFPPSTSDISKFVYIGPTSNSHILQLATTDDFNGESDGEIEIGILNRDHYTVASQNRSAKIIIRDGEPRITADPYRNISSVYEGQDAVFEIKSHIKVESDLVVNFAITQGSADDFLYGILPTQATIKANENSVLVSVPTFDDELKEPNGKIYLTLAASRDYNIFVRPTYWGTANVLDNEQLNPTISALTPVVEEGNDVTFKVVLNRESKTDTDLSIQINEGSNNFLGNDISFFPTIRAGSVSATISVPTVDDEIDEPDGHIHATLLSGSGYTSNSVASSLITDNDHSPVISIRAMETTIIEGAPARFRLTLSYTTANQLTTNIKITKVGEFIGNPVVTRIPMGAWAKTLDWSVLTTNDNAFEADGSVTVTILPGENYSVVSSPNHRATVNILDDDSTTGISITSLAIPDQNKFVIEGQDVIFQVTAHASTTSDRIINLSATQIGNFWQAQPASTIRLPSGQTRVPITIPTVDDEVPESDGQIRISIVSGTGYQVATADHASFTVKIKDNEPIINVITQQDAVTEGEAVRFIMYSPLLTTSNRTIHYKVTQVGNFVDQTAAGNFVNNQLTGTVELVQGTRQITVNIPIEDDEIDESDGLVTITVVSNTGYHLGQFQQSSISIIDNDFTMNIGAVTTTVSESQPAQFRVYTASTQFYPIIVEVQISQVGDFVDGPLNNRVIVFPAHSSEQFFDVNLADDDVRETNGIVTATLIDNKYYKPATSPHNQAQVIVLDNEVENGISIQAANNNITEGQVALFRVFSSAQTTWPQTINLKITSKVGDFLAGTPNPTFTLPANSLSAQLEIATEDDQVFESTGQIAVEILTGDGYQVASTPNHLATVDVVDNDTPNGVAIVASAESVFEGQTAMFQVSVNPPVSQPVVVQISADDGSFDFIGNNVPTLVQIPANQRSASYHVPLADDYIDEADGRITATMTAATVNPARTSPAGAAASPSQSLSTGLVFAPGQQQAFMDVMDNDDPPIISIAEVSTSITEGASAQFQISSPTAPEVDRLIRIYLTETGNFLAQSSGESSVTLPAGQLTKTFDIGTSDDQVDEANGSVTVTLLSATNLSNYYLLTNVLNDRTASVQVQDNDNQPGFSIAAVNTSITEPNNAQFRLTSSAALSNDVLIRLQISQTGAFLQGAAGIVFESFPKLSTEKLITIPVEDDIQDEVDGSITLTLLADTNPTASYALTSSLSGRTATVAVADDDAKPVISIEAVTNQVTEGSPARFRITSPTKPRANVNVEYTSSQVGLFMNQTPGASSVVLAVGTTEKTFEIATQADVIDEPNGSITITLTADSGPVEEYTLTGVLSDRSATVNVQDDDVKPVISISSVNSEVTEGNPAQFRINSPTAPSSRLDVRYRITQTGRVLGQAAGNASVPLLPGETQKTFDILTQADLVDEPNGSITVEILTDSSPTVQYTLTSTIADRSSTISVLDDDNLPTLSIASVANSVTEGSPAQFRITATTTATESLVVQINVSSTGNVIGRATGNTTTTMPSNTTGYVFDIATQSDLVDESDGSITVQLRVDTNTPAKYTLTDITADLSATVNVQDDDLAPVISIAAVASPITEPANAQFRITSPTAPSENLIININISQTNSVLGQAAGLSTTTLSAGQREKVFDIATQNDTLDEADGVITVELRADSNQVAKYSLTSTVSLQSASVTVRDDDTKPVISIQAVASPVTEPNSAQFKLTSPSSSQTSFNVRLMLSQTGNVLDQSVGTIQVEFPANKVEKTFDIATQNDVIDETDGIITLKVLTDNVSPVNYTPTTDTTKLSASVTVTDDDAQPIYSISAVSASVTEPSPAQFEISASTAPSADLPIQILIEQTGNVLGQAGGNSTINISAGQTSKIFDIAVQDDVIDEPNGTITVSLRADSAQVARYTVTSTVADQSASVTVNDDDALPVLSIEAVSANVVEPNPAQFRISSPTAASEALVVQINITQTESVLGQSGGNATITIPAGQATKVFDILTQDDTIDEVTGTITVTLRDDTNQTAKYHLTNIVANQSATVNVDDDEGLPVISITDVDAAVVESSPAQFKISSTSAPMADLTIQILIEQTGNVLGQAGGASTIVLPRGENMKTFDILVHDDDIDEPDGSIIVTLKTDTLSPAKYTLVTNADDQSASVTITDNDDQPVFAIEAVSTSVVESNPAQFKITSPRGSASPIMIQIMISQTGKVLGQAAGSSIVELPAGAKQKTFDILTQDDIIDEVDGSITVALRTESAPPITYGITATEADRSASVDVTDDDAAPIFSIESVASSVTEPAPAKFKLVSPTAASTDLVVNILIAQTGKVLGEAAGETTRTIPAEASHLTFDVLTQDDVIDEIDGSITVTLRNDTNQPAKYQVTTTLADQSASVDVLDDDAQPIIAIEAVKATITEAETAMFKLKSPTAPSTDIPIELTISQTGNVLGQAAGKIIAILTAEQTEHSFTIATNNDIVDEPDGTITATVNTDSSTVQKYTLTSDVNKRYAVVNVQDNDDLPVLSIAAVTSPIVEANAAEFRITSPTAPTRDVSIKLAVQQSGLVLEQAITEKIVTLTALKAEELVSLATQDDLIDEVDGSITLTLVADTSQPAFYNITTVVADQSAQVVVEDDDNLPEVSISAVGATITEPATAQFQITSPTASTVGHIVRVNITQTGSVLGQDEGIISISIPAGQREKTFTIATQDDDIDEVDGTIIATLEHDDLPTATYTVTSIILDQSASVVVRDDDALPTLSITHVTASVTEGSPARFTISTPTAPSDNIVIRLSVSQQGNVLQQAAGEDTETLLAKTKELTFEIATRADNIDEEDGSITITLLADDALVASYNLSSDLNNRTAVVNVLDDDDLPVISIYAVSASVVEPNPAQFRLVSPTAASENFVVKILIEQTGDVIGQALGNSEVSFQHGTTEKVFDILTQNDQIDKANGSITVTLVADSNQSVKYTITLVESDQQATVNVEDNDALPELSIEAVSASVTEPNPAQFRIDSPTGPAEKLTIQVQIDQTGSVLEQSAGRSTFELEAEKLEWVVDVATQNDGIDEENGTITVTLLSDSNQTPKYSVTSDLSFKSAVVTVVDDDDLPTLSIIAVSAAVTEPEHAQFKIISITPVLANIDIGIQLTQTHNVLGIQPGDIIITMAKGQNETTFDIATENDNVDERDGYVTATLLTDSMQPATYTLSHIVEEISATIAIMDDDGMPTLSVNAVQDEIMASNSAEFKVVTPTATETPLTVRVKVEQIGDVLNTPPGVRTFELPSYETEITFELPTKDEELVENEGRIIVTVLNDGNQSSRYSLTEVIPARSAAVDVNDQENMPSLMVSISDAADVMEGRDAQFTLMATKKFNQPIRINVQVENIIGEYLGEDVPQFVELHTNMTSTMLSISTINNNISEPMGRIRVVIQPGTDYDIDNNAKTAFVNVRDNDNIAISMPMISIISVVDSITEGEEAQFRIESAHMAQADCMVTLRISQTGAFIENYEERTEISLKSATNFTEVSIPTMNDSVFEENGTITVMVDYGEAYHVDEASKRADVEVRDNELQVSVVALTPTVTAGEIAMFEFTTNHARTHSQRIEYEFNTDSMAYIEGVPDSGFMLPAEKTVTTLEVQTRELEEGQERGEIEIMVLETMTYTPANPPMNSARVEITIKKPIDHRKGIKNVGSSVLPEMLRAMMTSTSTAVNNRLDRSFDELDGNEENTDLIDIEVEGQSSFTNILTDYGEDLNNDSIDWAEKLSDSAFSLTLVESLRLANPISFWGAGNFKRIGVGEVVDEINWTGNFFGGNIGVEAKGYHNMVAGATLSHFRGSMEYNRPEDDVAGTYGAHLTGFHPYFAWPSPDGKTEAHGTIGFGMGGIKVKEENLKEESGGSSYFMMAGSVSQRLVGKEGTPIGSGMGEIRGKAHLAIGSQWTSDNEELIEDFSISAQQLKLILLARQENELEGGTNVDGTLELGGRFDGGSGATGIGVDMSGIFAFRTKDAIDFSLTISSILWHGGRISDFGLQGMISYDHYRDELGPQIEIGSNVGFAESGDLDDHWENIRLSGTNKFESLEQQRTIEIMTGFGFDVAQGLGTSTPYGLLELLGDGRKIMQFGNNFTFDNNLEVSPKFDINFDALKSATYKLSLNGGLKW